MFVSLTFTDNTTEKTPFDNNRLSDKYKNGLIAETSFSVVPNINTGLDVATWETSLDSTVFTTTLITTIENLITFLNAKTTGYVWTSDYDSITVDHASTFTITENNFSSLILGCTDFTTTATSHTFNTVGLFPFNRHIIYSNSLMANREMSDNLSFFQSFQITGDEFWYGKTVKFDSTDIINLYDQTISVSDFQNILFNVGVILNDGTVKRINLTKTRPFTIKFSFENAADGLQ